MQQIRAIGFLLSLALCLNSGISYAGLSLEEEALFKAVKDNDTQKAKELIRKFVNVNARGKVDGPTPLVFAIANNNKELVEALIKRGANPDARFTLEEEEKKKDSHGVFLKIHRIWSLRNVTPLMYAAEYGHKDIVEFLISKGANVNHRGAKGASVLSLAEKNNHSEVVAILINAGAKKIGNLGTSQKCLKIYSMRSTRILSKGAFK